MLGFHPRRDRSFTCSSHGFLFWNLYFMWACMILITQIWLRGWELCLRKNSPAIVSLQFSLMHLASPPAALCQEVQAKKTAVCHLPLTSLCEWGSCSDKDMYYCSSTDILPGMSQVIGSTLLVESDFGTQNGEILEQGYSSKVEILMPSNWEWAANFMNLIAANIEVPRSLTKRLGKESQKKKKKRPPGITLISILEGSSHALGITNHSVSIRVWYSADLKHSQSTVKFIKKG